LLVGSAEWFEATHKGINRKKLTDSPFEGRI